MNDFQRDTGSQHDVASYIADMTRELAVMAASHGMPLLRYLLEMARDEALAINRPSQEADAADGELR